MATIPEPTKLAFWPCLKCGANQMDNHADNCPVMAKRLAAAENPTQHELGADAISTDKATATDREKAEKWADDRLLGTLYVGEWRYDDVTDAYLAGLADSKSKLATALAEVERLKARVTELEAVG